MSKTVIFGTRQVAEVVAFYLDHDSDHRVEAFTVDGAFVEQETFCGRPVVPFEELSGRFPPGEYDMFVAVGYNKINRIRASKVAAATAKGYAGITYVSSKAHTWPGLKIGKNSFVMEGNTVQPFASIGDDTILWSGNHLGHHSVIGDHCFLASQIVISGNVRVGDYCFIGVNATVRDGVTLGQSCVVGAGALILGDTADGEVFSAEATIASTVPSNRLRKI